MKESEIILYTTPNGEVKIDIRFDDETFWLTQQKIADLFGVDRSVVTKHLGNIYSEGGNWIKRQLVQNLHKFEMRGGQSKSPSIDIVKNTAHNRNTKLNIKKP